MPHSHTDGWAPEEIGRFADQHFLGATPLPLVGEIEMDGSVARAVVSSGTREKAELDVFRLHEHGLWATMQHDA